MVTKRLDRNAAFFAAMPTKLEIEPARLPRVFLKARSYQLKEPQMKIMMLSAGFAVLLATGSGLAPPAQAKGCIKGAVVGGVAGHYAGHHAVLGALGGCAIGHHVATKHAHEREMQQQHQQDGGSSGGGGSGSNYGH